jgi:hypothetical protein
VPIFTPTIHIHPSSCPDGHPSVYPPSKHHTPIHSYADSTSYGPNFTLPKLHPTRTSPYPNFALPKLRPTLTSPYPYFTLPKLRRTHTSPYPYFTLPILHPTQTSPYPNFTLPKLHSTQTSPYPNFTLLILHPTQTSPYPPTGSYTRPPFFHLSISPSIAILSLSLIPFFHPHVHPSCHLFTHPPTHTQCRSAGNLPLNRSQLTSPSNPSSVLLLHQPAPMAPDIVF